MMTTKQSLIETLSWFREMGIHTAVGSDPSSAYDPIRVASTQPPSSLSQRPLQPIVEAKRPLGLEVIETPKISPSQANIPPNPLDQCKTVTDLYCALEAFEGCLLKKTATKLVFADGNPQAKVMIIGEAPGADEDREGMPFVGACGQLLDRMLATIGLDRTSVYITNTIPWRPPGNRPPTAQEIMQCKPFVEKHIELICPKILILVGGVATKTLLNTNEGIMKVRGQWHMYSSPSLGESIPTMATFHPAFLMRSPSQKALAWRDLLMVRDALKDK